jgi:phosphoketolase
MDAKTLTPELLHKMDANHDNIHVRGYKEEGTITTPST